MKSYDEMTLEEKEAVAKKVDLILDLGSAVLLKLNSLDFIEGALMFRSIFRKSRPEEFIILMGAYAVNKEFGDAMLLELCKKHGVTEEEQQALKEKMLLKERKIDLNGITNPLEA